VCSSDLDLVQEGNQLKNADLIKEGDRLIVLTGKVSIVVSKGRNDLVLRLNDTFFKRYRVGTGKYSKTPTGTFVITDRQKDPVWWRPDGKRIPFGDKENILGTRWLSLKATGATAEIKGYGIHGTWDEATVGKSESAGCVRMKNSDVEELFKLVPVNTPVTITE
jgi:lipoprotein-anchoring transpeptidase ErfK/SrfK